MRVSPLLVAVATVVGTTVVPLPAGAQPAPQFNAHPDYDVVDGGGWTPDASVDVSIDADADPGNGTLRDEPGVPTDGSGYFRLELGGVFDVTTSQVITVTDGATIKTTTVTVLAVTDVDPDLDTVSGTATPGADVFIDVFGGDPAWRRHETADGSGNWTADFSTPGGEPGEEGTPDITTGTQGNATEPDGDGDTTQFDWHVLNPFFNAHPVNEFIDGYDWLPSASVDVTIDNDADPGNGTLHDEAGVPTEGSGAFWLDLQGGFDLMPGQVVTVTDGATTKTHTITGLTVTDIDVALDTVSGVATPGADVWVDPFDGLGTNRHEVADGTGAWSADFSVPGDEGGGEDQTTDIAPGGSGNAAEPDTDGDSTLYDWHVADPRFAVMPGPLPGSAQNFDAVNGGDFAPDATVDITVDDDADPGNGTLHDEVGVPTDGWGNFSVGLAPFELDVGQVVTVTDGTATKTHVVTGLAITLVDADLDTVTGTATPGADVCVGLHDDPGPFRHEVADGNGDWTADFATPGDEAGEETTTDLVPGRPGGFAYEPDGDGDRTEQHWRVIRPTINVYPANVEEAVNGWDWTPNASVDVAVDNDTNPFNGLLHTEPGVPTDDQGSFWLDLAGVYDLTPGLVVTVTDGTSTKSHTITGLSITDIDPDLDTVSGVATPGADVYVSVDDGSWRHEVADGTGDWTADLSVQGDEAGEEQTTDLGPGANGSASEPDDDGDFTVIDWRIPNTTFNVHPDYDAIDGYDWMVNSTIEVTIDDDASPGNGVLHTELGVPTDEWGNFWIDLNGVYDLTPGLVVTVTDGPTVKMHTITDLVISVVDPDLDVISGTAAPGTEVWVGIYDDAGTWRHEVADGSGDWIADFSAPGDEGGEDLTADIGPGSSGSASQPDDDGDATLIDWGVPAPWFNAHPVYDFLDGWDWLPETLLDVTIEDGGGPIYETSDVPTDGSGYFTLDLSGTIDLVPELLITVTDGATTKTHTVTALTLTDVDLDADTVSGTAAPGSDVWVNVYDDTGTWRHELADEFGDWTADFTTPGDEDGESPTDLGPGSSGDASQPDDDADFTIADWRLPAPAFNSHPVYDSIDGWDWSPDASVDITIDVDEDLGNGTLHDEIGVPTDGGGSFGVDLYGLIDLVPGLVVTVTDGASTKTHVITDIAVTDVDPDLETVSGTATPGSDLWVDVYDGSEAQRHEIADEFGDWTADFSAPGDEEGEGLVTDLGSGTNGNAWQRDDDGDATLADWRVRDPVFGAYPAWDVVSGWDWLPDATVDITVDADTDPDNGVLHEESSVATDAEGSFWTDLAGAIDIVPGLFLTVSDGTTIKTHTVTELNVVDVDPASDTVSGTAAPGADVYVDAYGFFEGAWRHELADASGNWTADFSTLGDEEGEQTTADLVAGSDGEAREGDLDGDETHVAWHVPDPRFHVRALIDNVQGSEWTPGTTVDVTIDVDDDLGNGSLYVEADVPIDDWGGFWTDLAFDVEVGHVVTVTDGETVKDHVVTSLTVTSVDAATDTVTGNADPGALVEVTVFDETEAFRRVLADEGGVWTADFGAPGGAEDEQTTADLVLGTSPVFGGTAGEAREVDLDRDATAADWHVLTPRIVAQPLTGELWGDDWAPDATVDVTVDGGAPIVDVPTDGSGHWYLGIELEPGQVVSVSDGETDKSLTVTALEVTAIDVDLDTVSGVASPGADVTVFLHNPFGLAFRGAVASGTGEWTANFAAGDFPVDLTLGSSGNVEEVDGEADATVAPWEVRTDATTDPGDEGATPEHPVTTAVTSPNPGHITIVEEPAGESPDGFVLAGMSISISAPPATPEDPLVIVFQLDASQIPEFETAATITLFKGGVEVADCTGAEGVADPDPCIATRSTIDGDIELTVLTSTASTWNLAFPLTAPDPPTNVTAVASDGQASVDWDAPADDGGAAITGYTVTSSPGGITEAVAAPTTEAIMDGLTNGVAYTFTVVAANDEGDSAASTASNAVTPLGLPGSPTEVEAEAGDERATVSWSAPADTGGAPIVTYTVTAAPGGKTKTVSGSATSTTVTGLTNGTAYTFKVVASNSVGESAPSAASAAVTPLGVPDAPTGVAAVAGDGQATVTWNAPADDGGSAITSYRVVTSPADVDPVVVAASANQLAAPATSATVTGLTNGTAYRFTVIASNSVGDSTASAASTPVTPTAAATTFTPKLLGGTSALSDAIAFYVATSTGVYPQRIAGQNRYDTAAATVADAFPGTVDTVYVATGLDFPDALAGSAAAAALDAPVLLVTKDDVPAAIAAQLARLKPAKVKLLGGTAAISDAVAFQIAGITGVFPQRIAGQNRYDTAAATVADAFPGTVDTVYVATGLNFPDALAGSAAAAALGAPVLLVTTDGIPASTAAQLSRLRPTKVKLLGGTAAISDAVAFQIAGITGVLPQRIAGQNRYDTAAATVADAFPDTVDTVYVATGLNFPDALAGSAAAAALDAPVLLVTTDDVPPAIRTQLVRLSTR